MKMFIFLFTCVGKRSDNCARTVVGPDLDIDLDSVGIPLSICKALCRTEIVSPLNIRSLTNLIRQEQIHFIRAPYDDAKNCGKHKALHLESLDKENPHHSHSLRIKEVIEKPLAEGDMIALNRQPSLHKWSIMGHRIKVVQDSTIHMNLSCVSPYNMDFDGLVFSVFLSFFY